MLKYKGALFEKSAALSLHLPRRSLGLPHCIPTSILQRNRCPSIQYARTKIRQYAL